MAEYKTDKQVNYGFGLSFEATGKAPIVAKRIWNTLADAQAYVNSTTDTAIAGLQLTVINDTDASKNGVYFVKEAAGENGKTVGVLVKLAQGADVSSLQTQITTNKTAIDNLNGTTHSTSVSKKITDAINKLDAPSNISDDSDDSYGVNIIVNQTNGLIQKPSVIVSPVETVSGVTSDDTAANKLITAKAVRLAIDEKVAAEVSGVRKFVGCVSALSELPENPRVGDVYNVTNEFTLLEKKYPAGTDVAWVGAHTDGSTIHKAHWEPLGGVIDFSSLSSTSSGTGNLVKNVTQTNGKVTVTKGNAAITDVTGLQAALDGKVAKTTKINNIALNGDLELYGKDIKITDAAQLPTVGTADLAVNDTIDVALSKLKRDINKVNTKDVVTSIGGQSGAITLDGDGDGDDIYKVKLAIDNKKLKASIAGLGTAAAKSTEDFVRMTPDNNPDNIYNEGNLIIGENIGNYTQIGNGGITITHTSVGGEKVKSITIRNNGSYLDFSGEKLTNIGTPTTDSDAATKLYVDGEISPVANKANLAVQSAVVQEASKTYFDVSKENTELIFTVKTASVGGNTDGLATAFGVKTYVDACVGNALTWATFE